MTVWPSFHPFLRKVSAVKRCPLKNHAHYKEVSLYKEGQEPTQRKNIFSNSHCMKSTKIDLFLQSIVSKSIKNR